MGRLFDAVAAILGVRDVVSYEAQAAVELEQRTDPNEPGCYRLAASDGLPCRLQGGELVRAVVDDLQDGVAIARIAGRFHNALARAVVEVCERLRVATGHSLVALSGGVFQNALLLERTIVGLEQRGFRVLTHTRVPANDGGISFGQAVVAAAKLRRQAAGSSASVS